MNIFIAIALLIVGFVMLTKGADWFVDGSSALAFRLGIPQLVIGLTIVAFGTSLPELVTSIAAARRGNADIAIGNIVGSNVFNILFVAGTSALISPIVFESKFVLDTAVATATAVLLLVCVCNKGKGQVVLFDEFLVRLFIVYADTDYFIAGFT